MSTNVVNIAGANLPAHIAKRAAARSTNADLTTGVSAGFGILSYKGKVWHLSQGGTTTLIADDEGDPKQFIEVVILKSNSALSKVYYAAGFEEGSNEKPTCYSNDGVAPEPDSVQVQAVKCQVCPHNQWGSKVTEQSSKGKACADVRRLAVAPIASLETPMLLRVPPASLKELLTYAAVLDRRGLPYPYVLTKIGFDHTAAYPKLQFRPAAILDEEQCATVDRVVQENIVAQIIGAVPGAPAGYDGTGAAPAAAAAPVRELTPEEQIEADLDVMMSGGAAAAEPVRPSPTRASKPKAANKAAITEDEISEALDGAPTMASAAFGGGGAAKAAAEPATTAGSRSSMALQEIDGDANLASILSELDD